MIFEPNSKQIIANICKHRSHNPKCVEGKTSTIKIEAKWRAECAELRDPFISSGAFGASSGEDGPHSQLRVVKGDIRFNPGHCLYLTN